MNNSQPRVVGFVGATGSGKTTLARCLVDRLGFVNIHIGRPLKDMLIALGLTEEDVAGTPEQRDFPQPLLGGKSARQALKTLGTDWGRSMISPDLWASAAKVRIERQLRESSTLKIVVDDLRFPNDWKIVQQLGGVILTVRRPDVEVRRTPLDQAYHRLGLGRILRGRGIMGWQALHETEFYWRDAPSSAQIWNDGSIDDLVSAALSHLS